MRTIGVLMLMLLGVSVSSFSATRLSLTTPNKGKQMPRRGRVGQTPRQRVDHDFYVKKELASCQEHLNEGVGMNGLFGVSFGEDVTASPEKFKIDDDKKDTYIVIPEKKFRNVQKVYCMVTPKTRRVYRIYTFYRTEDEKSGEAGYAEERILRDILELKFHKKKLTSTFNALYSRGMVGESSRWDYLFKVGKDGAIQSGLRFSADHMAPCEVNIVAVDFLGDRQAKKEKRELEKATVSKQDLDAL